MNIPKFALVGSLVVLLGSETINPHGQPFVKPETHTEMPTGAPSIYFCINATTATANITAHLIGFDSMNRS